MKILLIVVLLAVAVQGDAVVDVLDSAGIYNSIYGALQKIVNAPIDWAASITGPSNMSQMVKMSCAAADSKTFLDVPLNDPNATQKFNFNSNLRTIFVIHGYQTDTNQSWAIKFKNNWIASGRRANFCLCDWSKLAYGDYYTVGIRNWRLVSKYFTTEYLPWLKTLGLQFGDIVLMGHSLGAHIAGLIGQQLPKQINFIMGMDPAGPLFQGIDPMYRLSADDATYVQVIHTSDGAYGYTGDCGDADFYINLGTVPQPQCMYASILSAVVDPNFPVSCSHSRSVELISDSLLYPTQNSCLGIKCSGSLFYTLRLCNPVTTDIFGLDSAQKHGEFFTSTGTSKTCTGGLYA